MTVIFKLDLDMVKMYLHTKNEISMSRGSKVIAWTDRDTDRQADMTENITYPHMRVVIIQTCINKKGLSVEDQPPVIQKIRW